MNQLAVFGLAFVFSPHAPAVDLNDTVIVPVLYGHEVVVYEAKDYFAQDFEQAIARRNPDRGLIKKITGNWIARISDGLLFDLGDHFFVAESEEERFFQSDFIWKLLNEVAIDVNKVERNGFTFFENAVKLGDLELIARLYEHGAYTDRPIIGVTANTDGFAFHRPAGAIAQRGAIPMPIAVPSSAFLVPEDIRAFADDPRGLLKSGLSEVEDILNYVRTAFEYVDAVWISGGDHVWEFWYNNATVVQPRVLERDVLEMAVLYLQEEEIYKPVIGVCRGMQLANVFHGGSLREKKEFGKTPIFGVKNDGLLGKKFPTEAIGVSAHYQSLNVVAAILEPVAMSAIGVIEAVQSKRKELPLIGTQYHPEFAKEGDLMRHYIMNLIYDMADAAKDETCFNYRQAKKRALVDARTRQ